jgi:hypothetical protein
MVDFLESPKTVIDTPMGLITKEDASRLQFTLATSEYVIERGQKGGGLYYTMIILSNLDEAIVGIHESNILPPVVVYCSELIWQKLEKDGMPEEDVREYFEFNIIGAHMGAQTPRFVSMYGDEETGEDMWQFDK